MISSTIGVQPIQGAPRPVVFGALAWQVAQYPIASDGRKTLRIDVYCDESRPELFVSSAPRDGMTLIGSLWMPADQRTRLKLKVSELRIKHSTWGEFKWQKISPASLAFYHDVVDLFFDSDALRFRAIAIDATRLDLNRFHDSDGELGFYKFYYQLLTHWIVPGHEYAIFCDDKVNRDRSRLVTLGRVLGNANPRARVFPLQAVSSAQSVLIQLCDVLLGATQSRMNNSNQGSTAKASVIDRIESRVGHRIAATAQGEAKFNVFKIRLRSDQS